MLRTLKKLPSLLLVLCFLGGRAYGEQVATKVLRVGGDYRVAAIETRPEGGFKIEFTANAPSGKFDKLTLMSDHVHVAVKVGQSVRLSAEVVATSGANADVSQLVLFLPAIEGRLPVWLMSNRFPPGELRSTTYLEMHAPQNDFIIM